MTTTTDPVFASKTVSVRTQAITASSSSAGDSVMHTAATSRVEISNRLSPKWPIEYRVGSAAWVEVGEGKSTWLDIDLSTATLKIRRSSNAPASVDVVLTFEGVPAGLTAGTGGADVGIFTESETAAIQALVSGGGKQIAPLFLGAYGGVIFDAGSGNVMPTMRVVVNAASDIIAAQQITSNGAQAFSTTISGASSTGEVMVLAAGLVNITSMHVGFSTGASQTISADSTITINELVRFDFDTVDNVSAVRISFSPPRSSGRYIDVSAIGQQRG